MIFSQYVRDRKVRTFSLSSKFLKSFEGHQPNWGPVGYVTYKRTYSRPLEEGGMEEWWQTAQRVVEGAFMVQKIHCRQLNLPWDEAKAQKSAQDMYQRMWDFKFLPPGRGLWMMGTDYVYKQGSAGLTNCSFISTDMITEDFAGPFCFLMDMSMMGVGVGSDTRGASKVKIHMPKTTENVFVVEDSREGWVALLRVILESFVGKSSYPLVIDYSGVRGAGVPIKGFGGSASGPKPLQVLMEYIVSVLMPSGIQVSYDVEDLDTELQTIGLVKITIKGSGDPYPITSTHIVDIMNHIGCCVVAGNVRRCLPKGTIVHTSCGLYPIEKIKKGMMVKTSSGYSPVTGWVNQGVQKLCKIATKNGYLECTDNHQVAVISDTKGSYVWKKAGGLDIGDRLVFVRDVSSGAKTSLPDFSYVKPKKSTTCKDITIPKLDEDMSWFFGVLHGDGYVRLTDTHSEVMVVFAEHENDSRKKTKRILESFGVTVHTEKPKHDRCYRLRVIARQLALFLVPFKQPKTSIDVPYFIMQGTPSIKAAYIGGLSDADGCWKGRASNIVSSIYPDFLIQVKTLLASLGVPSKFNLISGKSREKKGWHPLYYLKLVGEDSRKDFEHIVAPYIHKYENTRKTLRSQYDYGFSNAMVKHDSVPYRKGGKTAWNHSSKQMTTATFERMTGTKVNLVPIEVLGIEYDVRDADTYDISVEAQEFVVNDGLLVHNSAEVIFGDPEDKEFMALKQDKEALESHRWACVTGDTLIDTKKGSLPIKNLVGLHNVDILLNGEYHRALGVKETGVKPVFKVKTKGGLDIKASANHQLMTSEGWVRVDALVNEESKLKVTDNKSLCDVNKDSKDYYNGYLLGILIGDGSFTVTSTIASQWGIQKGNKIITEKMESGSMSFIAGVVSGLFDADGWVVKDRKSLGIEITSLETLKSVQRMLLRLGVISRVYPVRGEEVRKMGSDRYCKCKALFRLVMSGYGNASRFVDVCGIHHPVKLNTFKELVEPPTVKKEHYFTVVSVEPIGHAVVYDICVPGPDAFSANGLYVHNSNNSIFAEVGMDYSEIIDAIAINGEPGLIWLENARKFSRMNGIVDNKDARIQGFNPCVEQGLESAEACFIYDTNVLTSIGYKKIGSLSGQEVDVVSVFDNDDDLMERNSSIHTAKVFSTGVKPTLIIETVDGKKIECSSNHPFMVTRDDVPSWVEVKDLRVADHLEGVLENEPQAVFKCVVKSITPGKDQPVFNMTVEGSHNYVAEGLVVHNCNLVETFPAHHEDYADYQATLKMAYLYAKTVTLIPTHNPKANAVMMRNRRIGCSMSGITQAMDKFGRRNFLSTYCDEGYEYIRSLDTVYSEWLCVPRSIKVTTVKPSGSVSLLAGATPGIHPPHSEYYIRRIRMAQTSPLVGLCRGSGLNVVQDIYSDDTMVVEFPVHEKHFKKGKADMTVWEQFANVSDLQKNWSDNAVSCLIGDTLIRTNKGTICMRALPGVMGLSGDAGVFDYVGDMQVLNVDNEWSSVSKLIVNPPKKTKRIMAGFHTLCGTLDHKVQILGTGDDLLWVPLSDIKYGDAIVVLNSNPYKKVFKKVLSVEDSGNHKTYDITVDKGHSYIANGFASHNCTISFKKEEQKDLKTCLETYEDKLKGISLLPLNDHGYKLAPYEAIDKATFHKLSDHLKPLVLDDAKHEVDEKFCSNDTCEMPFNKD